MAFQLTIAPLLRKPGQKLFRRASKLITILLIILTLIDVCWLCAPGRRSIRRRSLKKITPLILEQRVPDLPETHPRASGYPDRIILRNSKEFKNLVQNKNNDIIFRDEEGSGEDFYMTRRCRDRLNRLSTLVMLEWRRVKLRVVEAWDEEIRHGVHSLHYEGRAVDITTSDRDQAKYGKLARLAVEAGFDWVFYESRALVHVSVKTDTADMGWNNLGCFDAGSAILTSQGKFQSMKSLTVGTSVQTMTPAGELQFSRVIGFIHRDPEVKLYFLQFSLNMTHLTVTPNHLLISKRLADKGEVTFTFAENLLPGDSLLTVVNGNKRSFQTIKSIKWLQKKGAFAPLTENGLVVVNSVAASCYAQVRHSLAHAVFMPYRVANRVLSLVGNSSRRPDYSNVAADGIHWYPRLLMSVYRTFNTIL